MTTGVGAFRFTLPDPERAFRPISPWRATGLEPLDDLAEVPTSVRLRDRFVSVPLEAEGPIAPPISDLFLGVRLLLFDLRFVLSVGCLVATPVAVERPRDGDVDGCLVVICLPIRERELFELVDPFRLSVTPDLVETEFAGCLVVIWVPIRLLSDWRLARLDVAVFDRLVVGFRVTDVLG